MSRCIRHSSRLFLTLLLLVGLLSIRTASAQVTVGPSTPAATPAATPIPAGSLATVTLSRAASEVGEPLTLAVKLPVAGDYEEIKLEITEKDQKESVVFGKPQVSGPSEFTFEIRPLRSGDQKLGPFEVSVRPKGSKEWLKMMALPVDLKVAPPPGEADPKEIKDYTPPLELPFDYTVRNTVVAASGVGGTFALIGLLIFLNGLLVAKRLLRPPAPPLPPVEMALVSLSSLKSMEVFLQEGPERHYTILSTIVRKYFDQQIGIKAMEMTEGELESEFRAREASLPKAETLIPVLQRMSYAKFAKQDPTLGVGYEDCHAVEEFLLAEKERLALEERARQRQEAKAA